MLNFRCRFFTIIYNLIVFDFFLILLIEAMRENFEHNVDIKNSNKIIKKNVTVIDNVDCFANKKNLTNNTINIIAKNKLYLITKRDKRENVAELLNYKAISNQNIDVFDVIDITTNLLVIIIF